MAKRQCKTLTIEEKRALLKVVDEAKLKKHEIAKEFGIPANTLSTILKNREKYEDQGLSESSKRAKRAEFEDVDQCVLKWLKQCRDKNIPIGGPVLQEKAIDFAKTLGHLNFRASNGWLQNLKKRHQVVFLKVYGESTAVDDNVCTEWKSNLEKKKRKVIYRKIYLMRMKLHCFISASQTKL